jgi:hypothetical protein
VETATDADTPFRGVYRTEITEIRGVYRTKKAGLLPVLWIRDILVRIRIRGSGTSWYGSGSADPGHFGTDPDPEPALFRQWLSKCQQKEWCFFKFFAYYFLKVPVHLNLFSKIKSKKEVIKQ